MKPPPGADRYAVAGHPVAHSRSPFIHARFAELTGEAVEYGRLPCPLDGFAATVRAFAAGAGAPTGAGPARGCNVTVPFKFEAPGLCRGLTPRAALAQAVNTLRFDPPPRTAPGADAREEAVREPAADGGWQGDNTDGAGLVRDIGVHAGVQIRGADLLLIGAGGAAAGVLGPLIEAGARRIVLANRSPDKALALVARHVALARQGGVELAASPLDGCGEGFDIVVNATAASLAGAAVPVAARVLRPGSLALDMMYGEAAAPFLAWARSQGAHGRDGLGMLVEQAAEAFEFWRGLRPPTAEVLAELQRQVALESGRSAA
jgi:shikimate dehydrogenase